MWEFLHPAQDRRCSAALSSLSKARSGIDRDIHEAIAGHEGFEIGAKRLRATNDLSSFPHSWEKRLSGPR
jgi:hypothetical protein